MTPREIKARILIGLGSLMIVAVGLTWALARQHVIAPVSPQMVPTGAIIGVITFAYGATMRGGIG